MVLSVTTKLRVLGVAGVLALTACSDDDADPVDGGDASVAEDAGRDAGDKLDAGGNDASTGDSGAIDGGVQDGSTDIDANTQDASVDAAVDASQPEGTSSSKSSYLVPLVNGVTTTALLTVGDTANLKPDGVTPYRFVGIPDGLGAYDNNDGTFSLLMNHELNNIAGIARAHGGAGAFVSRWKIRKSDRKIISVQDLISQVQLWNGTAYAAGSNVAMGRFCSADLAAPGAFYNSATGLGFDGRLFLNGEETGAEGRAFAHGLDGVSYELPRLGKLSFENAVAHPSAGDKTIVVGLDDSTPGQVYVYVGTKTNTGNPVQRAGLGNGTLYGVAVTGSATEPAAPGNFTLASLGNVENMTGAMLQTNSTAAGVTEFNRPEDGAWDPSAPNDFYFTTTASPTTASKLWRLRFTDVNNPTAGGTVTAVLDGTEGQVMLDNLTIDPRGHIILQEDVGNNARLSQVWRYDIASDTLTAIAQPDPALFTMGAAGFITQDEESSGLLDATALLGPGWFLLDMQVHAAADGELVEGGQLIALYDPGSL